jgi:Ca-dependent carbohydrate-binding module xylan-binding
MSTLRLPMAMLLALCCAAAGAQQPRDLLVESVRAASFKTLAAGSLSNGDWKMVAGGPIGTNEFIVPHGTTAATSYTLTVTAYGVPAGATTLPERWPRMLVFIDGVQKGSFSVASATATGYTMPAGILNAGLHNLQVQFANPARVSRQQRALVVRSAELRLSAAPTLPGNAGALPMQSVTILNGFFPTNEAVYGLTTPCAPWLTGCRNIGFIKRLGATDVTFTSVCTVVAGQNGCTPQINGNNEEQALRVAMRQARALGLTITLKPFVMSPTGEVLSGYLAPGRSEKWLPSDPQAFFDSIEANLLRHATLAREEGASLLVLGTGRAANVCTAAAAVSNPAPGSPALLKLTYSPTLAGYWNDLDANEAPYLCFWDSLDYFGFNAYGHMNLKPTQPATAQLGSGFNAYRRMFVPENRNADPHDDFIIAPTSGHGGARFQFAMPVPGFADIDLTDPGPGGYQARFKTQRYATKWYIDHLLDHLNTRFMVGLVARNNYPMKALLTEVGAPSSPNVQGMWGVADGGALTARDSTVYQQEQARALDGYLRAFHGDPRVAGISLWGLMPHHHASYGAVPGWAESHDFNGKSATTEAVCKWFKKGYVSGNCLTPP